MAHVTAEEVARVLRHSGVDFPASKEELIRAAQAAGVSEEVIRALRALPPVEYANRGAGRSLGAGGAGPGARPEPWAAGGGHPGSPIIIPPRWQAALERDVPKPVVEEELDA